MPAKTVTEKFGKVGGKDGVTTFYVFVHVEAPANLSRAVRLMKGTVGAAVPAAGAKRRASLRDFVQVMHATFGPGFRRKCLPF